MKKSIFFCLALTSLLVSFLTNAQGPVYSVNVVGFQKVAAVSTNSGGLVLVANPFEKSNPFIDRVVGSGGVANASVNQADNVLLFDAPTQQYRTYWLLSNANATVTRKWRSAAGFATNVYLPPGRGFWYRNRAGTNLPVTMSGDVVTDGHVTNFIYPGLQLLSYPYSAPVKLGNITLTNGTDNSSVNLADNILIYNPVSQGYTTYWLLSNANATINRKWRSASGLATNVTVNPGDAFWYRSRANVTSLWVEAIPYNLSN